MKGSIISLKQQFGVGGCYKCSVLLKALKKSTFFLEQVKSNTEDKIFHSKIDKLLLQAKKAMEGFPYEEEE